MAALRGGYIGPDYCWHLERILNAKRFFDFSMADPPIYVIPGHGLFRLIGYYNAFPITYSILKWPRSVFTVLGLVIIQCGIVSVMPW